MPIESHPRRPRWLRSACVASLACAAIVAAAQVRFPSNPTRVSECEYANDQANALAKQYHERGEQLMEQRYAVGRQRQASCNGYVGSGNNNYWRCIAPYDERVSALHKLIGEAFAERDRIGREARAPYQQCLAVARAHEQQAEQQKQAAAENQRRQAQAQAEAQRRQEQAQAEAERSRRESESAQQRAAQQRMEAERNQREAEMRQRQAQQNQQIQQAQQAQQVQAQQAQQAQRAQQIQLAQATQARREYQAQLAADVGRSISNAAQAAAEARQPRGIATVEPSTYSPETRNEPRIVQTPEMREQATEQARANAQRVENDANLQTGQYFRDFYDRSVATKSGLDDPSTRLEGGGKSAIWAGDLARRDALDRTFNPSGYKEPGMATAVITTMEANTMVNEARGVSPVASQIAGDAYSGIGSIGNDAMGRYGTVNSLDGLSSPPAYRAPSPAPSAPVQVVSLDMLEAPAPASPDTACATPPVGLTRAQCLEQQCKLDRFLTHALCKKPTL